jgi:pimeloyl-ACP methyl ester carboxylesterase
MSWWCVISKVAVIAIVALVAITLTSVITDVRTVDGQLPENRQNLNATEIDGTTPLEVRTALALTKEYETGFVQANGITIAYESFGPKDQEAILLIAGTGSQTTFWPRELIDALVQSGYRVITFDNRDVGLSTKFTSAGYPDSVAITEALQENRPAPIPYTLGDMANDTVGLLDALNIQKAHIVGVSMGGNIAQLVAIDHPTRTLSLTLFASDSGNPGLADVAGLEVFAEVGAPPAEGDINGFVEYQVNISKALGSPGYPTDEEILREFWMRDVRRSYEPAGLTRQATVSLIGSLEGDYRYSNLRNIKVPTVVLQGTDDPIIPVESGQDLAANIPGADLFIIPGLGHDMPVQLVPSFIDAIVTAAERSAAIPQIQ